MNIKDNYNYAKELYASIGVDTDSVIEKLENIKISMHCWQGDDISGFENNEALDGGISVTGNYPGKAGNPEELRHDIDKALSLIPGKHKLSLHAIYAENLTSDYSRNKLSKENFQAWIDWAKIKGLGLDFNGTYFSHNMAKDGFTLSHPDKDVRDFWIEHTDNCRIVSEYMGKELGMPSVFNLWIPDGFKDIPFDRLTPRERLKDSLDRIYSKKYSKDYLVDALESKLFGIGSESYVTGSHEFYMGYAAKNNIGICLDTGHFHPTETVSNKLSSISMFVDDILLHVSRPMRWDSDHVVALDDELLEISRELVRGNYLNRVHIGLDYFDASINRIAAWVIGMRNMQKALLRAMLEPMDKIRNMELNGDYTGRLVWLEEVKTYPFPAVWDYFCSINDVPLKDKWYDEVLDYEANILSKR